MPQSAEQIAKWAKLPGTFAHDWTDDDLRAVLSRSGRLAEIDYEVFLQGSFANQTNITGGSSDLDMVVQMRLPFEPELSELSDEERAEFYRRYADVEYGWAEFREDVLRSLERQYCVHPGNKTIQVRAWDSLVRVPADILPAIEYRRYKAFTLTGESYDEGVYFRDSRGRAIVNYPKLHLQNGKSKDRDTGGNFKGVIRAVKNARNHAATHTDFAVESAPSYFIESLLYNVPNESLRGTIPDAFHSSLAWLEAGLRAGAESFYCQNGIQLLFGRGQDKLWTESAAKHFVAVIQGLCGTG